MSKYIALTFDDGPSNVTSKVLDILEGYGIPGTFFLIGDNIGSPARDEARALMTRQISLRCELCNHSLTHSHMPTLSAKSIADEISTTTARIKDVTGTTPAFFRPPFIDVNDDMYDTIDLPFICGVDSIDWDSNTSVQQRIDNIMAGARDGAIILMHDFTDNNKTVEALPTVIDNLREQGYRFVTVSELFRVKGVDPNVKGKIWSYVE